MNLLKNKINCKMTLLLGLIVMLVACSDENVQQDANDATATDQNEMEDEANITENESSTSNDTGDVNDTENNENNEEEGTTIEHQTDLKLGDTGTVVSGTLEDNDEYEVMLNKLAFVEEVEGENLYNEVFIKANVTIKNMEDDILPLDAIFLPTIGDENEEDITLFPSMKEDYFEDDTETEFGEEEIKPGESVVVDYYFDTNEADCYRFSFGNPIDQIITFVNWKISKDKM